MTVLSQRMYQLRKENKWSQDDLAQKISSSRIMIGNYERGNNTPSIEVLIKLSRVFDVSIDYLLGEGITSSFNKAMLKRLETIERLPQRERDRIFHYMDLVIRDYKAKQAYL